jgi:hypothetical protein
VLYLDHLGDARPAKEMLAMCNDRVGQGIHADRTFLLALYDKLEGLLQKSAVLVVKWDDVLFLKELH